MKPGIDYIGVGCGAFIVNDKREVLLTKRAPKSKNEVGTWNKIGGAIEFGETVVEALQREVAEEIGVKLKDIEFLSYTDHIIPNEKQHWVGLNFIARIKEGEPTNLEPRRNEQMRWFEFDNIPNNLAIPTKDSLLLMIKRYDEIAETKNEIS